MKPKKAETCRKDEACTEETGRNPAMAVTSAEAESAKHPMTKAEEAGRMEAVVERGNLMLAYQRVIRNKGAAGVDDIGITAFKNHLKQHWPTIKARLLAGEYIPQPVRRVDIP